MPPKQKKPKLSKAEQERLKREEEERKAAEEEALRLQEEKEEEERKDREKREEEERERQRTENERFAAERKELEEIVKRHEEKLGKVKSEEKVKAKWDRYMQCDGSIDPTMEKELNTYVSLWNNDTGEKEISQVLNECEQTQQMIFELKTLVERDEELNEKDRNRHLKSIATLEKMRDDRLDLTTLNLLQVAQSHVNEDSGNLEVTADTDSIAFCLWGNVAKNPRIKSFEFNARSFTLDLPKQLLLANVAIRLMITQYDHLSQVCCLYGLGTQKKRKLAVADKLPEETQGDDNEGAISSSDVAESSDDRQPTTDTTAEMTDDTSHGEGGVTDSTKAEVENSVALSAETEQQQTEATDEQPTEVPVDSNEGGNADDVSDDELLDDEAVVDLRQFKALGGIIHCSLLELPPQPKTVNNWTIREIVDPELVYLPYSSDTSGRNTASSGKSKDASTWAPLNICMKLPDDVCLVEEPQLARWDSSRMCWRTDGIADAAVNIEDRTLSFKTVHFGPIGLFIDQYVHMPFQSWEMRPMSENSAVLSLTTANFDVEIRIKGAKCCLTKPDDVSEISHLKGNWLKLEELKEALVKAGLNIFPNENGDKYVSVLPKELSLEMSTYHLMSIMAPCVAFSWSHWNADSSQDQIVIRACETLTGESPNEEDWKVFLCATRSGQLGINEDSDVFSDELETNTETHADIFSVFKLSATSDALQRIHTASSEFVDCVHNLLKSTRLVVYS